MRKICNQSVIRFVDNFLSAGVFVLAITAYAYLIFCIAVIIIG